MSCGSEAPQVLWPRHRCYKNIKLSGIFWVSRRGYTHAQIHMTHSKMTIWKLRYIPINYRCDNGKIHQQWGDTFFIIIPDINTNERLTVKKKLIQISPNVPNPAILHWWRHVQRHYWSHTIEPMYPYLVFNQGSFVNHDFVLYLTIQLQLKPCLLQNK